MRRALAVAAVVLADTALRMAGHPAVPAGARAPAWALLVALVAALAWRYPAAALMAALALAVATGGGYALLPWAAYRAGRAALSMTATAVVAGATAGYLVTQVVTVQVVTGQDGGMAVPRTAAACLVFVALPLLAGRYLAEHERLIRQRDAAAERERLSERLRMASDMHDSLGHRLGLISIQAAALEVAELPAGRREDVTRLARSARAALDDLHDLVGLLRGDRAGRARAPGVDAIGELADEFRTAGMAIAVREHGQPVPMPGPAGEAAYRVAREGLTNAARHAAGRPVTVSLRWTARALTLTIVSQTGERPRADGGVAPGQAPGPVPGHGLAGLGERVRAAGGALDAGHVGKGFRLRAVLPAPPQAGDGSQSHGTRDVRPSAARTTLTGLAAGFLMFLVLPMTMLAGAR